MAQNITFLGASYQDVPAVTLPKTGGGTARFTDTTPTTATDSDVASGKIYVKADGSLSTGTASGGGATLQAKTNIDPTTSSQTITADTGYDGLSSVQINAMPSGTEAPSPARFGYCPYSDIPARRPGESVRYCCADGHGKPIRLESCTCTV